MNKSTLIVSLFLLVGCRGGISHRPPIHIVPDMDFQPKIVAQQKFEFVNWTNHRGMRRPVDGVVERGFVEEHTLDKWVDSAGNFISNPLPAIRANYQRGRERFNIYCAVCHDRAGTGNGPVLQRAKGTGAFNPVIPDLGQEQRLRDLKDGELYWIIRDGKNTMPAYGPQIPVRDRWAIVHYVRALQNRIKN